MDDWETLLPLISSVGAIALGSYLFIYSAKEPPQMIMGQSVTVGEKKKGETAVYRNFRFKDKLLTRIPLEGFENIDNMDDFYRECVRQYADKEFIGTRVFNSDGSRGDFVWKTYKEIFDASVHFARGLLSLGANPSDRIGIYSGNCEEWKITEIACYISSLCIVSLYDSLGPNAAEFTLRHAEISTVVCSPSTFDKLISACENGNLSVKNVILYSEITDTSKATKLGIKVHTFSQVIQSGKSSNIELQKPKSSDLCSIMYTSGTTGDPKGVMLTHGNCIASIGGFEGHNPAEKTTYLSYLPLAHIMERSSHAALGMKGSKIGFFSGDIKKLREDFQALKPDSIVGAPRVFQRVYDSVMNSVEQGSSFKKWLFFKAYEAKKKSLALGQQSPFWDRLIFDKVNALVFGGNATTIISGSAPLSPKVHEFLKICFGKRCVIEGYGATETVSGCCMQSQFEVRCGHVGPPIACCEIKLVDVPQMGYTSEDKPFPRGEICVRGANVSPGYFKNKEKTDEVFDSDGWYHTGDIGRINEDGTLSIIDRAKNIFKLSQGEYVAPEYLETVYSRSSFVAQCFVYGDSHQPHLVAVVVPDEETVKVWANKNLNSPFNFQELCTKSEELKKVILEDMTRVGKEAKLNGFEFIKSIHLESTLWNLENGILTPTMKLKRHECKNKYLSNINDLYSTSQTKD